MGNVRKFTWVLLLHTRGSGDATTNRCINYEARHLHLRHALGGVVTRILGVESSADHTSKTQVGGWVSRLKELVQTFNRSPLACREQKALSIEDCAVKLTGMGGDHAADQIKTHGLLACWKKEMTYRYLARNHLEGQFSDVALERLITDASAAAVAASGGLAIWTMLSSEAQTAAYVDQFNNATMELGRTLYERLPTEERRPLDLFMRLGCAMHKDLNSVKGGNSTMTAVWAGLHTAPPVLLANKENASILQDVDLDVLAAASSLLSTEDLTAAELRALESSTRGGVKLASLAGALFNHKDDKKGHHDTYVFYFRETIGQSLRFPDTSNTRYGSYCAAAAELLVNREHYLRFLEVVRDRKERPGFNHIEENIYRGLQDVPTLTELAVLSLYGQAISHPYLRTTRVLQNGLKLGPFHQKLKAHLQTLINAPELLLSPEMSSKTAAMDGEDWERPEVISAVLALAPQLPHLKSVLQAFLEGALYTWERFTVEFAEGGAIDLASDEELDQAYLLPTNDHNEGALGSYRIWSRKFPNGSQAYYNALAKFFHNDTAAFVETHLSSKEDQQDIRRAGRAIDSSGHEAVRQRALVAHTIAVAARHAREQQEKQARADAAMAKVNATVLILDIGTVGGLRVPELEEQLEAYRKREKDPMVPAKSKLKLKQDKAEALTMAIARYHARTGRTAWVPEAREAAYIRQPTSRIAA
ncbi:hypothetical protein BN946_scf185006.g12 [Trametes cinnabarina]|uniref:Uncharacterized protein n=1 Tax=Pycnoporus cinnabarinus TaxID=5643 RepID=A0A060SRD8_PYCCI|nr:hypothetical protein BN946_scf185006.g12 [Trametes cinnabarina]